MKDLLPLGFLVLNVLGVLFIFLRKRLPKLLINFTALMVMSINLYDIISSRHELSNSYMFKDRVFVALVFVICAWTVFIYFLYQISGFGLGLLGKIGVKNTSSANGDSNV